MQTKKANELKPGEIVQGKVVEIVDAGKDVTIIHFKDTVLPLMNTADVLVDDVRVRTDERRNG